MFSFRWFERSQVTKAKWPKISKFTSAWKNNGFAWNVLNKYMNNKNKRPISDQYVTVMMGHSSQANMAV